MQKACFGLFARRRISASRRRYSSLRGRPSKTTPSRVCIPMPEAFFHDPDRLILGMRRIPASYEDHEVPWGISHADRRNHCYIVGKTGMGKTALLRNIILADI